MLIRLEKRNFAVCFSFVIKCKAVSLTKAIFVNTIVFASRIYLGASNIRARLHGKRVPRGDRGTLPSRVEDTAVLHAS